MNEIWKHLELIDKLVARNYYPNFFFLEVNENKKQSTFKKALLNTIKTQLEK